MPWKPALTLPRHERADPIRQALTACAPSPQASHRCLVLLSDADGVIAKPCLQARPFLVGPTAPERQLASQARHREQQRRFARRRVFSRCSVSSCDARSHVVSELPIGGSTDVMLSE